MGEALLQQGHLDLAIDTTKKLVDINPANFVARVRLAQMVQMNGDTKQAMELVSLVTKTSPDYAIGWEAAARIAIAAKEWLPAEEAIRTLDKIEGQHLTASFLEGQVLEANGKSEEAITESLGEARVVGLEVIKATNDLTALSTQKMSEAVTAGSETYRSARVMLIVAVLATLLLSITAAVWVVFSIHGGLKKIGAVAQALAIGDLDQKVDYKANDEIGDVIEQINVMTDSLRETANVAQMMAVGDLSKEPKILSDKDT